jgi:aryl-alcohol dehydrogenase-like predicted oxidoreductase
MKKEKLPNTDLEITKIGLGAWQFGTEYWGFGKNFTEEDCKKAIVKSLEKGINWIDTAWIYGDGFSEEFIGKVLMDIREEILIATKFSGSHARYNDVKKACEESLRRLKRDYIELYQYHWPNSYVPLEETARAINELIKEGKIRYFGVSNFSKPLIEELSKYLEHPIVSNQVRYSLADRSIEKETLPYCTEKNIAIIAYSPLCQGLLTGKYDKNNLPPEDLRTDSVFFKEPNLSGILNITQKLKEIAKKYNTKPSVIALAWLIKKEKVFAIPGAKNEKQAEENAKALYLELSEEDQKVLDSISSKFILTYYV